MKALQTVSGSVVRRLTDPFLRGHEAIDIGDISKPVDFARPVNIDQVEPLLAEAMLRFPDEPSKSDPWVGPRLHALVRLTRNEAADPGLWAWLAITEGQSYVRWRWGPDNLRPKFYGRRDLQALSRVWWTAELFRNGDDYRPAETALGNTDITNTFLRMDVADHRPTSQSFLKVPSRKLGREKTGREANALAKAVNCAATTLAFELIAPDPEPFDADARLTWCAESIEVSEYFNELPLGPPDPKVPESALAAMTDLLTTLFKDAPVRGEKLDDETIAGEEDD